MSRCVPCWCSSSSEYEVAELTWENGQLALHGLGLPRVQHKPHSSPSPSPSPWEKPRAGGTLESIVDQAKATTFPSHHRHNSSGLQQFPHASAAKSGTTLDVLVPSPTLPKDPPVDSADDSAPTSLGQGSVPSVTGSAATLGHVTPDTPEAGLGGSKGGGGGFTVSTSSGNADEHHSVCHGRPPPPPPPQT